MKKHGNDEYEYRYQDQNSLPLNIHLNSGFLHGDRIEQLRIPRDQDHPSFHLDRILSKQLEIPPWPEFIPATLVRMAIATVIVWVSHKTSQSKIDVAETQVLVAFASLCLLSVLLYCWWAIATQPRLKFGVIYLWLCIAFGSLFAIIGEKYV